MWKLTSDIMRHSAKALCEGQPEGFSVLNIGFGLGIIDEFFQQYSPGRHVIIEPHPDALTFMKENGWYERPGVEVFEGTWEKFMLDPEHAATLGCFDAIYFDTYSQDYQGMCDTYRPPYLLRNSTQRSQWTRVAVFILYVHANSPRPSSDKPVLV